MASGRANEGDSSPLPSWLRTTLGSGTNGIIEGVAFLAFLAVAGLIARWLRPHYDEGAALVGLLLGVGIGIAAAVLIGRYRRSRRQTTTEAAIDDANRLLKLDETLFRHLLLLTASDDVEIAINGIVREVLQNIVAFYGDEVVRATVFRPSGDALCAWVGYQMPQESLERLRFPLDPPAGAPVGVALQAYRTKKIQFERMKKLKDGRWRATSTNYVVHDAKRSRPPYSDFVAIPLAFDDNVIGVVCLDSLNVDAFVKGRDEEKLTAIALRISAPLTVHDSLAAQG